MAVLLQEVVAGHGHLGLVRPRAAELALRPDEDRAGVRVHEQLRNIGDREPVRVGLDDLGDVGRYLTANAYLGCFGIVDALSQGADIVITGRVTDAAVVCGPAAWHHGWAWTDFDQLAGGVVAGHVIECSGQVTGGNYSFFDELDEARGDALIAFGWAMAEDLARLG